MPSTSRQPLLRYLILTLAVLLLIASATAQQNRPPPLPADPPTTARPANNQPNTQTSAGPAPAPATAVAAPAPTTTEDARPTDEPSEENPPPAQQTSAEPNTPTEEPSSEPTTAPPEEASTTGQRPAVVITGGSSATRGNRPSNLPTIAGAYSYPPPSVPPTANAPFMQQSTLPEGTVFIAVGAALGFLGFSVLAWRGLVAWSLHRSVKRAALHQKITDNSVKLRPRGNGFYAANGGSTMSLDHLSAAPKNSMHGPRTSHMSSGSLFYSPTARVGSGTLETLGSRTSTYLPSGYYPSGNAAAGGGANTAYLGTPGTSRGRSFGGPSPPVSPSLSPSRGADPRAPPPPPLPSHASTSSLNLSVPPQGRAPSAYLEDLFESHQSQKL